MKDDDKRDEKLQEIGRGAYESIKEMVEALEGDDPDAAREAIEQDPLSIEVRSDWHSVGEKSGHADGEFRILLSTGGPATRIVGNLENGEPAHAQLEAQDWFTPWTEYRDADEDVLLSYARCFCFEEG